MKKFKRLLASFIAVLTLLAINPVSANAEWKQSNNGWWYEQGSSYATGWTQIGVQWYYFDNNGYMKTGWLNDGGTWYYLNDEGAMVHDCYIGADYLGSNGALLEPVYNNTGTSSNSCSTESQGQTAYLSATGDKYHSIPNCGKMNPNKATKTTVAEAEKKGISRCTKCW